MPVRRNGEMRLPAVAPAGGAAPAGSPTDASVPPHKKPNNLVVRSVTILILGPSLFLCAMHSKEACTTLIFLGVFIAAVEWAGLKRHLKVALLLWGGNGGNLHELHESQRLHDAEGRRAGPRRSVNSAAKETEEFDSLGSAVLAGIHGGPATPLHTPLLTPWLPSSPLLPNGEPLRPEEYGLPVTPISLYAILKAFGWAGLALAAYVGVNAFAVTIAAYFLIFVCVTVMAHNRLEMKVERATAGLSHLDIGGGASSAQKHSSVHGTRKEYATKALAAKAVKKAQRDYFMSLELQMIAEKQPTEQFLDFCLDIFGILWISGLVYPIFFYHLPRMGLPWGFATLLGNFCNDIIALVVGRSLKTVRQHYAAIYDLPHIEAPAATEEKHPKGSDDEGEAAPSSRRPLTEANRLLQLVLRGPHPLYPAISPNKSAEGAAAGVVTNALVFCASMYVTYHHVMPLPEPDVMAPGFHCVPLWLVVGFVMGVLGVVGDLLQSLLKRAARVKDAGFIVPGHGGILDRLDGCLLVFPFMFCTMNVLHALSQPGAEGNIM